LNNTNIVNISAYITYNGLTYLATKNIEVSSIWFNRTVPTKIGYSSLNFSWNYSILTNSNNVYNYSSNIYNQNYTTLKLYNCTRGELNTTLNITFKDELLGTNVPVNLTSSIVYYWHYNVNRNKTLSYAATNNDSYYFCMYPFTEDIKLNTTSSFIYSAGGYATRTVAIFPQLTNTTTNITLLYLLSSSSGIYTTFQVVNNANQPLADTLVKDEKLVGGIYTLMEQKYTDAAGSATFFVDYNLPHRYTFSKAGYNTYTTIITPTQSSYTITLSSTTSGANSTSYVQGINYGILPNNATLNNNTDYLFAFQVNSTYWNIDSAGFTLRNKSNTNLGSATCTGALSCTASSVVNTGSQSYIIMDYYWVANSSYQNGSYYWYITPTYVGNYSLLGIMRRDIAALGSGFSDFTKMIICLIIIIMVVGGLAYASGTYSPIAIVWEIFGLVFLLEMIGLTPTITNAVPYFNTIILGIVAFGYTLWEYRW